MPIGLTATFIPYEYGLLGTPLELPLTELSAGGLSLVSQAPRPLGGKLILKLDSPTGLPLVVLCEIRHCRPGGRKEFHVGAVFVASAEGAVDIEHFASAA